MVLCDVNKRHLRHIRGELIIRSVVDNWELESSCSAVLNSSDFIRLKTAVCMLFVAVVVYSSAFHLRLERE